MSLKPNIKTHESTETEKNITEKSPCSDNTAMDIFVYISLSLSGDSPLCIGNFSIVFIKEYSFLSIFS